MYKQRSHQSSNEWSTEVQTSVVFDQKTLNHILRATTEPHGHGRGSLKLYRIQNKNKVDMFFIDIFFRIEMFLR